MGPLQLLIFKRVLFFGVLFFSLASSFGQSAGVIINEVSNGPSGSQEWVELLVVGDPLNPTDPVDLTGWILDDNNGDFEVNGGGVGIASGHIILSSAFNSVTPGSLIIIYNDATGEQDPVIPADDTDDTVVPDGVYILPANDASLNVCTTTPNTGGDASYVCSTPILSAALVTNVWTRVGLRNGGDAMQVRLPDGSFYHGFSYGDVTAPFPTFPISSNPSFNAGSGSGGGSIFYFGCGDWEDSSNFTKDSEVNSSPGVANSSLNQIFIDKITDGTFDYTDLSNSTNCSSTPVPIMIITNRNTTYRVNN